MFERIFWSSLFFKTVLSKLRYLCAYISSSMRVSEIRVLWLLGKLTCNRLQSAIGYHLNLVQISIITSSHSTQV